MISFDSMRAALLISFILFALFTGSCKKHSSCVSSGGGKGGTGTIRVIPTHSGVYVDSCWIYIKYGTLDEPANGVYDDSQYCTLNDTIPVATFNGLKPGIYYFYGNGYHLLYQAYVKGAANYTLCSEQTVSIYLPTYPYIP